MTVMRMMIMIMMNPKSIEIINLKFKKNDDDSNEDDDNDVNDDDDNLGTVIYK
jgi:hypothetical protein